MGDPLGFTMLRSNSHSQRIGNSSGVEKSFGDYNVPPLSGLFACFPSNTHMKEAIINPASYYRLIVANSVCIWMQRFVMKLLHVPINIACEIEAISNSLAIDVR